MSDSARLIYHNDKLTLVIPSEKTIDFQKICAKYDKDFPPNVVKKVGKRYIICKSLTINNDSVNAKSNTKSSECDTELKRKNFYIKDEISFKNCVFCNEVHFKYITFAPLDSLSHDKCNTESNKIAQNPQSLRIDFQHCEFRDKAYFTNCTFNANVFFNHAVFHKYADFHESIFNGIVSFYNATFNSAPNFSTCVFANLQATNFINVKIEDLDFEKIKDFINEYENDSTYKRDKSNATDSKEIEQITNKHKIRYASNARDSFRTIKKVLIANNNLLDASNWHKLELYAKEIELRLPEPESTNNQNNKYKKRIDLIQLCLYRHTSEHHTDLLKILSWFIILVGFFATLSFMANYLNGLAKWASMFWIIVSYFIFLKAGLLTILALPNCIPCILLLTNNPKLIFGVANLFTNDKCQSDWLLNLILSLYSIFFILLVFSLQKTARKNSIIPS